LVSSFFLCVFASLREIYEVSERLPKKALGFDGVIRYVIS